MAKATSRNRCTFPNITGSHQTYDPISASSLGKINLLSIDREEATKEDDFVEETFEDEEEEEEEWEADTEWNVDGEDAEGDVKDESTAYLEFLNEEVGHQCSTNESVDLIADQAQKFGTGSSDDDDELEEEGLLETPLDQVEPYGLFKDTLMSKLLLSPGVCQLPLASYIARFLHSSNILGAQSCNRSNRNSTKTLRKS